MTKDEALKLALEALTGNWTNETECEALHAKHMESITAIKEALAQPEQEPVAWGMMNDDGKIYDCICPEEHDRVEGEYTVPLYTTPPQRKPLTDEEIDKLPWEPHEGNPMTFAEGLRYFARAIEAAHGIKE